MPGTLVIPPVHQQYSCRNEIHIGDAVLNPMATKAMIGKKWQIFSQWFVEKPKHPDS